VQVLKTPFQRPDRGTSSVLETLNVDTGKRTVLREFPDTIEAPNWTRDGRYLIYNSCGRIFSYEIAKDEAREIYTGAAVECNNDHVLSAGGSRLAVSHRTIEDGLSRVYILPISGGEPVLITPMAPSFLHGWSPDGKTLVYTGERNGRWNIYSIPAAGGQETGLTDNPALDDGPEYSPDGKYIWFNSTRSGLMQIWRMDANGDNQIQITFDESNSWFPHLSPDGKRAAYITYRKGDVEPNQHPPNKNVELRMMPVTGEKDFRVIAELFGGQGTMNVNSWAPDNQTIAFVSYKLIIP
jgi:Tol biopolymer transport system component